MRIDLMTRIKKYIASVLTVVFVLSSFCSTINADTTLRSILNVVTKESSLSDDERQVTITIDSQWKAIPEPKILFWQANICDYHGLTNRSVAEAIYAARLVGEVDYYIDACTTQGGATVYLYNDMLSSLFPIETNGGKQMIRVIKFSHIDKTPNATEREQYIQEIIAQLPELKSGYHTVTMDCLDRLVNRWNYNPEGSSIQYYDYLIMLYDGLVASGVPSSSRFYTAPANKATRVIPYTDEDKLKYKGYAEVLKDIPTLHLTPSLSLNTENVNSKPYPGFTDLNSDGVPDGPDVRMHLDTVPYYDYKAGRITYQSYDAARNYFEPYSDSNKWKDWTGGNNTQNAPNLRLTANLMLYSMAYLSPNYYLNTLVDSNGQFKITEAPSTEEFTANLPAHHTYSPINGNYNHIFDAVNQFVSVDEIDYTDTLAPGLSLPTDQAELAGRVRFSYCVIPEGVTDGSDWAPDENTEWFDVTDGVDLVYNPDTNTLSAILNGNYYAMYIRMEITADVDRTFGMDGKPTDTNVGYATVDYVSHSESDTNGLAKSVLHHQDVETPNVTCTLLTLTYDMKDSELGHINGAQTAEETVKLGFSPYEYNPANDENGDFTINDGYALAGFILTLEDDPTGTISLSDESTTYADGDMVAVQDVNNLILTQNTTLTALYGVYVTFDANEDGHYGGSLFEPKVNIYATLGNTVSVPELSVSQFYTFIGYKPNRSVTIGDTTYTTDDFINAETLESYVVDGPITFTAFYLSPVKIVYDSGMNGNFGTEQSAYEIVPNGSHPNYGVADGVAAITVDEYYTLSGFTPNIPVGEHEADDLILVDEINTLTVTEDITFTATYIAPNTITYDPGVAGIYDESIADADGFVTETVAYSGNPALIPELAIQTGYTLRGYEVNKDVVIDGITVEAGSIIPASNISKIVVTENITLTAIYTYQVVVPTGVGMSGIPMIVGAMGVIGICLVTVKRRFKIRRKES